MAKPGLDGHDLGLKVVSAGLRDAGMEVIYGGLGMSIEDIVLTAMQEDVDVIGLSILSGAHLELCSALHEEMRRQHLTDVIVVVGGVVPKTDYDALGALGVAGVCGPGTKIDDIVRLIEDSSFARRS